jgi:hypothetical protein
LETNIGWDKNRWILRARHVDLGGSLGHARENRRERRVWFQVLADLKESRVHGKSDLALVARLHTYDS